MAEYIEREAAIAVIHKWLSDIFGIDEVECTVLNKRLNAIPAADVVPVQHGRWIWDKDGMDWGIGAWRCSECKAMSPMWWNTDKTNPHTKSGHRYCPNCGARMDGDSE